MDHPSGDFQHDPTGGKERKKEGGGGGGGEEPTQSLSPLSLSSPLEGRGHRPDRDLATAPRANAHTNASTHVLREAGCAT